MEQIEYASARSSTYTDCIARINTQLTQAAAREDTVRVLSVEATWSDGELTLECWFAYTPKPKLKYPGKVRFEHHDAYNTILSNQVGPDPKER